jgi:elongation factor P--beta-lysine ligase
MESQEQALQKDAKANRTSCQRNIRALLQHRDFVSVRPPALADLPQSERREWESFWGEADDLLQKANG